MSDLFELSLTLDEEAKRYFNSLPKRLQKGRKAAVKAQGMVWADKAKLITRADGHIDTGLYVNSIGYKTNIAGPNGALQGEPILIDLEYPGVSTLRVGSSVGYASVLEARYNIMARAFDAAKDDMLTVGVAQTRKHLLGR